MRKTINLILLVLIGINVLYVISGVTHFPMEHVDVYSIWLLRAKAFYIENGLPLNFLLDPQYLYSHPDYPLLLTAITALIYKFRGGIDEMFILSIYPFIYSLILLLAYKTFTRMKIKKTNSLIFVYIYSMFSPLLAQGGRKHAGMADIWLTLFYWLFVFVLMRTGFGKKMNIWLLTFLAVLATQIKKEGIFFTSLFLFLPVSVKKRSFGLLLVLSATLLWLFTARSLNIPATFKIIDLSLTDLLMRLIQVPLYFLKEMLNLRNWYLFWPVFFGLLFISKEKNVVNKKIIIPALMIMSLGFYVFYIFTTMESEPIVYNVISSTSDRLLLQISPLFYTIFVSRVDHFVMNLKLTLLPKT